MPEMLNIKFRAERIKNIRIILGETQDEFAQRLGVTVASVAAWEGARVKPTSGHTLHALIMAEREAERRLAKA